MKKFIIKQDLKVDGIITSDWHLMEEGSKPPCRLDSIWEAQWNKVQQIVQLQIKYNCPVLFAGDLFESYWTSPNLTNKCLSDLPKLMKAVIGNHDMPQHNIELLHKSGIETLLKTNRIEYWTGWGDWKSEKVKSIDLFNRKVIMLHVMTFKGNEPYPNCPDPECNKLFKMFPDADLIITGHNHQTFTSKKGNQLLINPGSLTRHKADQLEHKPCVFLWNAASNTIKAHYLKIDENVMSRQHIEVLQKKEQIADDFLIKLKETWDVGFSFEDNVLKALEHNEVPKDIENIILNWINK